MTWNIVWQRARCDVRADERESGVARLRRRRRGVSQRRRSTRVRASQRLDRLSLPRDVRLEASRRGVERRDARARGGEVERGRRARRAVVAVAVVVVRRGRRRRRRRRRRRHSTRQLLAERRVSARERVRRLPPRRERGRHARRAHHGSVRKLRDTVDERRGGRSVRTGRRARGWRRRRRTSRKAFVRVSRQIRKTRRVVVLSSPRNTDTSRGPSWTRAGAACERRDARPLARAARRRGGQRSGVWDDAARSSRRSKETSSEKKAPFLSRRSSFPRVRAASSRKLTRAALPRLRHRARAERSRHNPPRVPARASRPRRSGRDGEESQGETSPRCVRRPSRRRRRPLLAPRRHSTRMSTFHRSIDRSIVAPPPFGETPRLAARLAAASPSADPPSATPGVLPNRRRRPTTRARVVVVVVVAAPPPPALTPASVRAVVAIPSLPSLLPRSRQVLLPRERARLQVARGVQARAAEPQV